MAIRQSAVQPHCGSSRHQAQAQGRADHRCIFEAGGLNDDWRKEYRKCDHCRGEYRPKRQAQSYCSPTCKRAAAYGRERFAAGTKGRRRRRLEASETGLFPQRNQYPASRLLMALRWFGPQERITRAAPPLAPCKATTIRSTITRTVTKVARVSRSPSSGIGISSVSQGVGVGRWTRTNNSRRKLVRSPVTPALPVNHI